MVDEFFGKKDYVSRAERVGGYQEFTTLRYFVCYSVEQEDGQLGYFRNEFTDLEIARFFLNVIKDMDTVRDYGVTAEYGINVDEFLGSKGQPTPYGYWPIKG